MPMQTSHERQYQLSMLSQVGSLFTFCQLRIVRTMQQAAVRMPRLMRTQRPVLMRREMCTFQRMKMGKMASRKSEIIDMTAGLG